MLKMTINNHPRSHAPHKPGQQGSTLLIALVLLAAMTILALSTGFSALSEEKSARSYRDGTVAFNAAEDATRRVQLQLLNNIALTPSLPACSAMAVNGYTPASGTTGLCQAASNTDYLIAMTDSSTSKPLLDSLGFNATDNRAATFSNWTTSSISASGTTTSAESITAPKYFVEVFNAPNPNGELAGSSLSGNLNMNEVNTRSNAIKQYRVTASGFGPERFIGNPATQTIESTFQ